MAIQSTPAPKIVISCPGCGGKIRVPRIKSTIKVTCPRCRAVFQYKPGFLRLSTEVKQLMLSGALGGFTGFTLGELGRMLVTRGGTTNPLAELALTFGLLGISIGCFLGATEGYYKKNRFRLKYGLKMGAILGGIGGILAGFMASVVFSALLSNSLLMAAQTKGLGFIVQVVTEEGKSVLRATAGWFMFARTIGWAVFGTLLGVAYGIKENTMGDLKYGAIAGAIGGTLGGILFDPLAVLIQGGQGAASRLLGFTILGMAIGTAIRYLQENALGREDRQMYKPISYQLPPNLRLE